MAKVVQFQPVRSYNTKVKVSGHTIQVKRYKNPVMTGYTKNSTDKSIIKMNGIKELAEEVQEHFHANERDLQAAGVAQSCFLGENTNEIDEETKKVRFGKSLNRARTKIYDIIACNAGEWGSEKTKFLTLTFKDNVTDLKEANEMFTKFMKRLSYQAYGVRRNVLKYLCVPELQERGAWHYHVVMFNCPFIPATPEKAEELKALGVHLPKDYPTGRNLLTIWGNGGIYVEAMKDNKGNDLKSEMIAGYITKYIGKGYVETESGELERSEDDKGIKNLSNYDNYKRLGLENMKRYQCSRGLKRPVERDLNLTDAEYEDLVEAMTNEAFTLDISAEGDKVKTTFYEYEIKNREGETVAKNEVVVLLVRMKKAHAKAFVRFVNSFVDLNRYKQSFKVDFERSEWLINCMLERNKRNKYTEPYFVEYERKKQKGFKRSA